MKLLVGLGNPGEKYGSTRHNAGFLLVDALQDQKIPKDFIVRKSDMFMNESGIFVKKMVDRYGIALNDLYVAHDDLDIPLGSYKIQFGVGPKIHNGVNSVEKELGTKDFWRVRIGVENRNKELEISGEQYVLQDFTEEEKKILKNVITEICKKLVTSLKNTN